MRAFRVLCPVLCFVKLHLSMKVRRHAAGVATWSDVEPWGHGALEPCCAPADVKFGGYGALEDWGRAVGVEA